YILLSILFCDISCYCGHRDLHSFPTRRSSDLADTQIKGAEFQPNPRQVRVEHQHPLERADGLIVVAECRRGLGEGEHRFEIGGRSEEHTSELQSRENLVCRLLLEKKKNRKEKI